MTVLLLRHQQFGSLRILNEISCDPLFPVSMNCLGLILTDYYGCLCLIEYDRKTIIKNIIYFIMNIAINTVCYKINQVTALKIAIEIYNDNN